MLCLDEHGINCSLVLLVLQPDHAFLVAGFPVYRLPVYVRRLVAAGHKVGVVRQVRARFEVWCLLKF